MNLHRSEQTPEWDNYNEIDRNVYQHVAVATRGILTPGNVVSAIGLGLVLSGANDIKNDDYLKGTAKTVSGKLCDLVDGWIAEKTKTKSRIGEAVDATFDKIGVAATFMALRNKDFVPNQRLVLFGVQNSVNVLSSVIAKRRNVEMHSSQHGKIAFALQGVSIGSSLVGSNFDDKNQPLMSRTAYTVANGTALAGNTLGALVSFDYLKTAMITASIDTSEELIPREKFQVALQAAISGKNIN